MRILLALLLLCRLAGAYPAGTANQAIRIPSTGGPPKAGSLDISKSAAVTGLTNPFIPFWDGAAGVGLGNSGCSYNAGSPTLLCNGSTAIQFQSLVGPAPIEIGTTGVLSRINNSHIQWDTTLCTTSPCTITRQFPTSPASGISSITRAGLGSYTVNFTGSFWTVAPACLVQYASTDGRADCRVSTPGGVSTTTLTVTCTDNFTAVDLPWSGVCTGQRY